MSLPMALIPRIISILKFHNLPEQGPGAHPGVPQILGPEIPVLEWEWDGVGMVGFSTHALLTSRVGFFWCFPYNPGPLLPKLLLERLSQLIPWWLMSFTPFIIPVG